MTLHMISWEQSGDPKGNHGSVRKRARAIQCHCIGGATCLVASDDSLRSGGIYTDSVDRVGVGGQHSLPGFRRRVRQSSLGATAKCNADSRSH